MRAGGKSTKQARGDASAAPETGSNAPSSASRRTVEEAVGTRVRALRKRLDMTVAELAGQAGLSVGMLSKIENGATSPSLATLQALADAFNMPISTLFAELEEARDCSYVRRGRGVTIDRRGTRAGHQYQLLGHSLRGEVVVEPYLITLSKEAQPYANFRHAGVEFIYMLSGAIAYRHADKIYDLAPGDALFFDAGAPHGPATLTRLPSRFLSIIIYPRDA
jgi:transcriptional regulator with XRE-family HTH domain